MCGLVRLELGSVRVVHVAQTEMESISNESYAFEPHTRPRLSRASLPMNELETLTRIICARHTRSRTRASLIWIRIRRGFLLYVRTLVWKALGEAVSILIRIGLVWALQIANEHGSAEKSVSPKSKRGSFRCALADPFLRKIKIREICARLVSHARAR